ncbi:HD domain-containing protein [Caldibacillus lycopersici]|uniref:HD domain-containing protein n=1 Tax=Perspicuibacillus lycopersici TaxID=1325689 RepID=A0AAE3LQH1_9BACI|nr:HD domain-containing phosphohydrolase [Perspicuibacillus lycopersici]MCU9613494.1 HD domain-containing protein [Perspicuibacillus lycopersici]
MKVKVANLSEGYQIIEDIMGLTKYPIVPKNTPVTNEIIEILNAFQVEEVDVELAVKTDKKGKNKQIPPIKNDKQHSIKHEQKASTTNLGASTFFKQYIEAVATYKKEFIRWQSGMAVDIAKIREFLIPLLDLLDKEPKHLLSLPTSVNKNDYIFHHSVSVGLISGYLAMLMNMKQGNCYQVALAGCLSDCGMARIDPLIFRKILLNNEDKVDIKEHPTNSYKMLQPILSLKHEVKLSVLQHHERLDGSGYPFGLQENKIHLFAKIISIADVYHALVSNRVYKEKVSPYTAIDIISENPNHFDSMIYETLARWIVKYSLNVKVKLSTNQNGEIVYIDSMYPTRPFIKIENSSDTISLVEFKDIKIKEIL